MKIENYKGIDISHDATKDEFFTDIVINKTHNGKKEYLVGGRLQKLRDGIDKYLITLIKKPIVLQAWKSLGDKNGFVKVDIVCYNYLTKSIKYKDVDGRFRESKTDNYRDASLFLSCKENDAIVKAVNEKVKAVEKLEKEYGCTTGKLIPFKEEHFVA